MQGLDEPAAGMPHPAAWASCCVRLSVKPRSGCRGQAHCSCLREGQARATCSKACGTQARTGGHDHCDLETYPGTCGHARPDESIAPMQ